ncbi:carbonic anhydrase [Kitasatospora azatica]|uniref:hypothetical protein n=1 Tax=Kitasatospora azatica TaxID=58347 RepID=UPI0018DE92F7|nr:hypothetical protein [Kitasatospora azatica]
MPDGAAPRRVAGAAREPGCRPASAARASGLDSDADLIDSHIRHTVDLLLDRSRVLADQVASGRAAVVGLAYQLAEGSARLVTVRGIPAAESAATNNG